MDVRPGLCVKVMSDEKREARERDEPHDVCACENEFDGAFVYLGVWEKVRIYPRGKCIQLGDERKEGEEMYSDARAGGLGSKVRRRS